MLTLTVPEARSLLRSRPRLLDSGLTDRELRAHVTAGRLRRVRRGWYVRTKDWVPLWPEERHLVEVTAAHLNADAPGPVMVGVSAAVLHALPLYRLVPEHVHALIEGTRHGRSRAGIRWHDFEVPLSDMTVIDGIRCTTLARTVLDVAGSLTTEGAVAAADAAFRSFAALGPTAQADIAEEWRGELSWRAQARSTPGIRQARTVIAFADARAESPGESVSRLQLHRLGFTQVDLQAHVILPAGEDYRLDFAFERSRSFGEFDGLGKYTDPRILGDRTPEEVLIEEKKREDAVRGVTGWGVARWGSEHIRTARGLGARLRAFGIAPP